MKKRFTTCLFSGILVCISILLGGCNSTYTMVAPTPPEKYEVLGPAEGKASGSLGIISTSYYVLPMGLNSRIERAYSDALEKVPGATSLIDVSYEESWFWWFFGTARTVTVKGLAIKEVAQ